MQIVYNFAHYFLTSNFCTLKSYVIDKEKFEGLKYKVVLENFERKR